MRNIKIGQKFGKLTILNLYDKGGTNRHKRYECVCDCGKHTIVGSQHIGIDTFSCGCLVQGKTKSYTLYNIYKDMKRRCYNPKRSNYKYYGGKGIKVCDEWLNSFKTFKEWSLANGFVYDNNLSREERLSIDRIDVTKDYSPDNCRWIPFKENRQRSK